MFPARENRARFFMRRGAARASEPIRIHPRSRVRRLFTKSPARGCPSLNACRAVRIVRGGVPGFETVGGSVETAGRENT